MPIDDEYFAEGELSDLSRQLTVQLRDGRSGWIIGNARLSRGRFRIWFAPGYDDTAFLHEVETSSPEAKIWLNGFLAGSEPTWAEFSGNFHLDRASGLEVEKWQRTCAELRHIGRLTDLDDVQLGTNVTKAVHKQDLEFGLDRVLELWPLSLVTRRWYARTLKKAL